MRSYIKEKEEIKGFDMEFLNVQKFKPFSKGRIKNVLFVTFALLITFSALFIVNQNKVQIVEVSEENLLRMNSAPVAATGSTSRSVISIPSGTVKTNPFVPYRAIDELETVKSISVPTHTLVEPPEEVVEGSDAARVMDTIVSGILYDKYSPSAIINIEGVDYLVKKGDVVNNYKVLCIAQDSVTVKLGENTYKAGIGEILTEGTLNHNDVSNLNNKFGGAR